LRSALKRLDAGAERILFVVDGSNRLIGTFTDGDARRALLGGVQLESPLAGIFNPNPVKFEVASDYTTAASEIFRKRRITHIPIIDREGRVVDIIRPDSADFGKGIPAVRRNVLDVPVIIMAGGKGTRMAPFTNVLPKPLIPIGEKTILEMIMDGFAMYGAHDFRLTVNYKGEMIRAYFEGTKHDYNISYTWEKEFFGTAGSIRLVENPGETFIVSNCDILVKTDFSEVLDFHKSNKAALTVVSSIQHHKIPYGVIEYAAGGKVSGIKEKPEFSFPINTGVYVLDSVCLDYIPDGRVFNMTDLIDSLLADGKSVFTFPVNEREYIDIGQWEEYRQAVSMMV